MKAQTRERAAFLHFLLTVLDQRRAQTAFEASVTFKPFKLREPEMFKRVAYEWVGEFDGFQVPFKQEFLTSSPRNMRMMYCIANKVMEVQIQRLVRQLGSDAPFTNPARFYTSEEEKQIE